MSISVKIEGLDAMNAYFKDYLVRKKRALLAVVAKTTNDIKTDAIIKAPIDLGELRGGIIDKVYERKSSINGDVLSAAPYSAYVEFGSRPHWTGIANLRGWAERHGIPAYLVQKSIAEKGTPAQPYMVPAVMENKNPFIKNVIGVMSTK